MRPTSIDDLVPWVGNPREISSSAAAGLGASLVEFGDISGITFNARTSRLICGHQRVAQLRAAGAQWLDGGLQVASGERYCVRVVDWSEEKERMANVAANNGHIGGVFTSAILPLLDEIKAGVSESDYRELCFDKLEAELAANDDPTDVVDDDVPEPPAEPVTRIGDVWELGDHRLACMDCRDADAYQLVMDDAYADAVITDPPYGIDYDGGTKKRSKINGDTRADLQGLLDASLTSAYDRCRPGAAWYVTAPSGPRSIFFANILLSLGVWRQTICWVKNKITFGRSDYQHKCETIFYGWKQGAGHLVPPDRTQTTVWEVRRPDKSKDHPTMKPVELFAVAMTNSTKSGWSVLDPFLGSGTTLIAAEQLGRRCYGIEIEPRYCDVIIERWEDLTGGKARRIING